MNNQNAYKLKLILPYGNVCDVKDYKQCQGIEEVVDNQ